MYECRLLTPFLSIYLIAENKLGDVRISTTYIDSRIWGAPSHYETQIRTDDTDITFTYKHMCEAIEEHYKFVDTIAGGMPPCPLTAE